ncbi:MAG: hypothetical protein SF162_16905 [bacterium]|nr:hypothetical protein [bacterium]
MTRRAAWITLVAVLAMMRGSMPAHAQTDDPIPDLVLEEVAIVETVGVFGQPIQELRGRVVNTGERAYTNLSFTVETFDDDDQVNGGGIGTAVNACGAGLLLDFALQPGHAEPFAIPLELDEPGSIERYTITPFGDAIPSMPDPVLPDAVQPVITDREIASVEWINDRALRFGVGCRTDLFNTWEWYTYNVRAVQPFARPHPYESLVTPELAAALRLDDPSHSMLTFAPTGDRLIYQNAINTLITAGFNGGAQRTLYSRLSNRSLQQIYWLPEERFIAYYFGGYGEPVFYFTASAESSAVSPFLDRNPPSISLPGVSWDARRVLFSGELDSGALGYSLYVVTNGFIEPLFEATPPGNNYPAPLLLTNPADNLVSRVYLPLDVDGEARLFCFDRAADRLIDLAPLPLRLAEDERAQWWISPDEARIALAATGTEGGLWVIDLAALPACGLSDAASTPEA